MAPPLRCGSGCDRPARDDRGHPARDRWRDAARLRRPRGQPLLQRRGAVVSARLRFGGLIRLPHLPTPVGVRTAGARCVGGDGAARADGALRSDGTGERERLHLRWRARHQLARRLPGTRPSRTAAALGRRRAAVAGGVRQRGEPVAAAGERTRGRGGGARSARRDARTARAAAASHRVGAAVVPGSRRRPRAGVGHDPHDRCGRSLETSSPWPRLPSTDEPWRRRWRWPR